jgi:hypothetical protein
MKKRIKTIKIQGLEFCEIQKEAPEQEISILRIASTSAVAMLLLFAVGLVIVNQMLVHTDATVAFLKWGFGLGIALLYVFAFVLHIVVYRKEMRIIEAAPAHIPHSGWLAASQGAIGWLYVKDGWLIFESEYLSFKLSKDQFVEPSKAYKSWKSKQSSKLILPDGFPLLGVWITPHRPMEGSSLVNPAWSRFRKFIERWLEEPYASGKPLYPPLRPIRKHGIGTAKPLRTIAMIGVCSFVFGMGLTSFYALLPEGVLPNPSPPCQMGLIGGIGLASILATFIFLLPLVGKSSKKSRGATLEECVSRFGSTPGEIEVE